ncbi:MAG TPA: hypothetical protein PLY80_08385 [Pseudomonadota bacterium]|nr:hypothetical protein [Pseudomonadota bacterium]
MRATFARFGVGVGLLLAGCALAPPTHPSGLPRVPRYTNSIQLDFLLSSYRAVAEKAAMSSESAKLLDEACLGWERAVLDLHGARLYPSILRQTPETLMLEQVWQDLPKTVEKYPRPAVCDNLKIPVSTSGMPKEVTLGVVASTVPPAASAMGSGDAASPTPPPVAPSPTAPPADGAGIMPPPAISMPSTASSEPLTPVARERVALQRLRIALSLPPNPPANLPSAAIDPTLPLGLPGTVDLPVLRELAESDLPTVKLRARYHLLGLCTLAVETADRNRTPISSASQAAIQPADPVVCGANSPNESLRAGQRRLLRSLLSAWRARYSEPMADFVTSLASFVSRDNPVLDGPRTSR